MNKLEMIMMCRNAILTKQQLEYYSCDKWRDSDMDLLDITACIINEDHVYRVKSNTTLDVALKIVTKNGYRVTKEEETAQIMTQTVQVKKFVPFKGQIVQTNYGDYYMFNCMDYDRYMSTTGFTYNTCNPIPGVICLRKASEYDNNYKGRLNIRLKYGAMLIVNSASWPKYRNVEFFEYLD